jgi:hypothetical protein
MLKHNPLKSKTFWGAILTAGSMILLGDRKNPSTWSEAIGIIIVAVGLKDAAVKSQEPESPSETK